MVATGWSDAQRRAYVLADNKLALNAGWDAEMLSLEIKGIADLGFNMTLAGFGEDELAALSADKTEGLTDPDDVPETPETTVTVLGDVWLLGAYFKCEECGKQFSYEDGRKMGGECVCDAA